MFDLIDGGIPATFRDGPKQGHVGVVTPENDVPPRSLAFGDGGMVYERVGPQKVKALDAEGHPVTYAGVGYRIDKTCPFMREVAREVAAAKALQETTI